MDIVSYRTQLSKERHNVLIKEKEIAYDAEINFDNPKKIVEMMNTIFQMDKLAEEYMYQISFDSKMKILGIFEISHGLVNATLVSARELMIRNLLCGAACFIICHNHPSGEVIASREDITITRQISEAGKLMGIPLHDSIIIGSDRYYSFHEDKQLD